MRKNRKNKYMLLLVLLLAISVGYALLSTTLKINGSSIIAKNTWSVYWANPVVTEGSVTSTLPTIGNDTNGAVDTVATWSTSLSLPGDFYEFTIDAVNAGTIDAMITDIEDTVTPELPSYIKYEVTYYDGETIAKKHLLSKKSGNTPTTEKYKVRVEFLDTISTEELNSIPEGGVPYTFTYEVTYSQADDTGVPRPKDYLKVMNSTNGNTQPAFDNTEGITKAQVEKIYTLNTLEMPSDLQNSIIKSWDVSDKEDGSIMAYALDADSNSKYEIYLGQKGGVKANPNSSKLFNYYTNVTEMDLSNLITDDVENMYSMFQKCDNLVNIVGEENWNTSNVTNMTFLFNYCSLLTSIDVSHFDTSNVTSMRQMFNKCSSLISLDVSGFDTYNVTDMAYLFSKCSSLTNLDLSHFDTSRVTTMFQMFNDCTSLTSLDVSHFDTSNVTEMRNMFARCSSLTSLDVSHFDTSKVTDMYGMFGSCSSLTSLDVSHFDTSNVIDMSYMFSNCSSLTSLDVSRFNMGNVTNTNAMFNSCSSLQNLVMPNNYTHIDNFMFNHVSSYPGESFTIPKTVTSFGYSHLFYDFGTDATFNSFIVEEGNTALKAIDGILYSYDGTKLLAVPRGKTFTDNTYTMPDSVTTLNTMSFSRNQNIDKLVISDNLVIDRYYDDTSSGDTDPVKGNRLNTGIYVYTSIKEYEAKSTNSNYSSYGGCIYSKDGTELIAVPVHYTGVLNIKSGTATIGEEAFWVQRVNNITSITTINIPASVTTIEANQLTTLNKLITKGVVINIDSSNASYEIVNNQIVAK